MCQLQYSANRWGRAWGRRLAWQPTAGRRLGCHGDKQGCLHQRQISVVGSGGHTWLSTNSHGESSGPKMRWGWRGGIPPAPPITRCPLTASLSQTVEGGGSCLTRKQGLTGSTANDPSCIREKNEIIFTVGSLENITAVTLIMCLCIYSV